MNSSERSHMGSSAISEFCIFAMSSSSRRMAARRSDETLAQRENVQSFGLFLLYLVVL